jgi:hypothetical protein
MIANSHVKVCGRVAKRDAQTSTQAACRLDQRVRRNAIQTTTHFLTDSQSPLETHARPQELANSIHKRGGARLFANISIRVRTQLTKPKQEILLPAQQDDGHVSDRHVAFHLAAQGKTIHAWHQDVAYDKFGSPLIHETQCPATVLGFAHFRPSGSQRSTDEPRNRRIIIRNQDAPAR